MARGAAVPGPEYRPACLLEAALEAWAACGPEGMTLREERLPPLLPGIAEHVPGAFDSPEAARRLNQLFNSKPGTKYPPLFTQMVRAQHGQVHFVLFWRAFGEAARHVAFGSGANIARRTLTAGQCSLGVELDAFRDEILASLEALPPDDAGARRVSVEALVGAAHAAAASSALPAFWRAAIECIAGLGDDVQELGLEELAVVFLSWLHEAAAFQPPQEPSTPSALSNSPWSILGRRSKSGILSEAGDDASAGTPVYLHVYDVSQEESVQKLNRLLAHRSSPLKFGGVFHAGVEVDGLEWSYGCSTCETIPGISCGEPRTHPQHHFRQTIVLRRTKLTPDDIADIISDLIEEYPGDDYDLLRRNCCHFADDFAQRLGAGRIPRWVHRLAHIGARLDGALQVAQGLQEKFRDALLPYRAAVEEDTSFLSRCP